MNEPLHIELHEHIQLITLNRPEKKNAFSSEMITQWVDALETAQRDDRVHVIVVTGNGDAFCSGGDMQDLQKGRETRLDAKNMLWEDIHRVAFTMNRIDKPVIAAINGAAVGAGLDMALMADFRTMALEAKVSEGYVKVGLIPGDGGAYFLPRIVGQAKALELLWTGRAVDATEALEIGLVNHTFPRESLLEETLVIAKQIADGPQVAIRMMKRAARQSEKLDLETSLDLISSHMSIITATEDHKEGVQAFLDKRKPAFVNR
ncbi:enoyl-CoA hydratase/isomerase family protein [Geomicrobium sediminis]|uniref:2-(1,2-epoxy-1,2-dihydrophenyl)acetyl-CoA isomerase n=1 Tax=Geomicrobium sediminis TaxID=1347788 RepID=A0ABS2PBU3_9BACL|nr:enoyl-CoA hydratase-related protein [Geomicrobium sediminis]MBM7632865.1 2-(1,2-epoxy-1,2-dihydrophenyl)acetyl-CoA isomerase [Geomicrobium sediminis]